MKPRFLIDADEVLANFVDPAAEIVSRVLGQPWTIDDAPKDTWDMFSGLPEEVMREVDAAVDSPGWCLGLEPYPGTQDLVTNLRKLCEVFVVTSPRLAAPEWVFERNDWLRLHFGFDSSHVIHTSAKHVCVGAFFLDDNPDHVKKWQEQPYNAKGLGMLWTTKHNKRLQGHDDLRVRSKDEVLSLVVSRLV